MAERAKFRALLGRSLIFSGFAISWYGSYQYDVIVCRSAGISGMTSTVSLLLAALWWLSLN